MCLYVCYMLWYVVIQNIIYTYLILYFLPQGKSWLATNHLLYSSSFFSASSDPSFSTFLNSFNA